MWCNFWEPRCWGGIEIPVDLFHRFFSYGQLKKGLRIFIVVEFLDCNMMVLLKFHRHFYLSFFHYLFRYYWLWNLNESAFHALREKAREKESWYCEVLARDIFSFSMSFNLFFVKPLTFITIMVLETYMTPWQTWHPNVQILYCVLLVCAWMQCSGQQISNGCPSVSLFF